MTLTAQLSGLGFAFRAFALALLPVVFFLGVATHGRLLQITAEWRTYGQGMNRIRHYFLEVAPQTERYLVLPATDDPWVTLAAVGIRSGGNPWWQALLTAGAIIVVVNSVLAGVFAGLLWRSVAGSSGPVPLALAAAAVGWSAWGAWACMASERSAATWRPQWWSSLPAITTADLAGGVRP